MKANSSTTNQWMLKNGYFFNLNDSNFSVSIRHYIISTLPSEQPTVDEPTQTSQYRAIHPTSIGYVRCSRFISRI